MPTDYRLPSGNTAVAAPTLIDNRAGAYGQKIGVPDMPRDVVWVLPAEDYKPTAVAKPPPSPPETKSILERLRGAGREAAQAVARVEGPTPEPLSFVGEQLIGEVAPPIVAKPPTTPSEQAAGLSRLAAEETRYKLRTMRPFQAPGKPIRTGRLTYADALSEWAEDPSRSVLWAGGAVDALEAGQLYFSAQAIEDGVAKEDDWLRLKEFNDLRQRVDEHGVSIGYRVIDILSKLPGWGGEIMVSGPAMVFGRGVVRKTILSAAKKAGLRKVALSKAGVLTTKAVATLGGGALQTTAFPHRIAESTLRRMRPDIQVTEDEAEQFSAIVFDEGDNFLEALSKGALETGIEVWSEHTGGALRHLPLASKVRAAKLAVINRWFKKRPKSSVADLLKTVRTKAAWHGPVGEIFEEEVGKAARVAVGLEDYEITTLDELVSQGIAFSVPGVVAKAAARVAGPPSNVGKELPPIGPVAEELKPDVSPIHPQAEKRRLITESQERRAKKFLEYKAGAPTANSHPGANWFTSVIYSLGYRNRPLGPAYAAHPIRYAAKFIGEVLHAKHDSNYNDGALFRSATYKMSKAEQEEILPLAERWNTLTRAEVAQLYQDRPRLANAAFETRKWLDHMRGEIQEYARNEVRRKVPADIHSLFDKATRNEIDLDRLTDEVIPAYEARTGREVSEKVKDKIAEAKEFTAEFDETYTLGLEDYIPKMELGQYQIIREEAGTEIPVARAESTREARRKLARYAQDHPDADMSKLFVTTDIGEQLMPVLEALPQGQQEVTKTRLQANLDAKAAKLQDAIKGAWAFKYLRGGVSVKATPKFAGPLQKRMDIMEGEREYLKIMPAYSNIIRKTLYLNPVIAEIKEALPTFTKGEQEVLGAMIAVGKGKYYPEDAIMDKYVSKRLGVKGMLATRTVSKAKGVMSAAKLGYRLVSAFGNRAVGEMKTWVATSPYRTNPYFWKSWHWVNRTQEGKDFWESEKQYSGADITVEYGGKPVIGRPRWFKPGFTGLGWFSMQEPPIRKHGMAANYLMIRDVYGPGTEYDWPDDVCREDARLMMHYQQTIYELAAIPRRSRSPLGRLSSQFQTVLGNEMQFLTSLSKAQLARYVVGTIALAGPMGVMMFIRALPLIGAFWGFRKLDEMIEEHMPVASRGIFGVLFGVDITAPLILQPYQRAVEWLGPFVGSANDLHKTVLSPYTRGVRYVKRDLDHWFEDQVVQWRYWNMFFDSVFDEKGRVYSTGPDRKLLYELGNWADWRAEGWLEGWQDRLKFVAGAKPLKVSQQARADRLTREANWVKERTKTNLVKTVVERSMRGRKPLLTESMKDDIEALYGGEVENFVGSVEAVGLDWRMTALQRSVFKTNILDLPGLLVLLPED